MTCTDRARFSRVFFAFVTFLLLGTESSSHSTRLTWWATFLGVSSTLLAAFQYLPQIVHTYRHKLVGALSIPMMCIQTPGAILMVTSIAIRYVYVPDIRHSRLTAPLDR